MGIFVLAFELSTITGKIKESSGLYKKYEKHEHRELIQCKLLVLTDDCQNWKRLFIKHPDPFKLKLDHEFPHLLPSI